jgi:hypothetical protein
MPTLPGYLSGGSLYLILPLPGHSSVYLVVPLQPPTPTPTATDTTTTPPGGA